MLTTIDLPLQLVEELKERAEREGCELDAAVALLLRKGLDTPANPPSRKLEKGILARSDSGLPVIVGGRRALPEEEMTPDRVAEILMGQEVAWHREATTR